VKKVNSGELRPGEHPGLEPAIPDTLMGSPTRYQIDTEIADPQPFCTSVDDSADPHHPPSARLTTISPGFPSWNRQEPAWLRRGVIFKVSLIDYVQPSPDRYAGLLGDFKEVRAGPTREGIGPTRTALKAASGTP
jgi:hypothetical protein